MSHVDLQPNGATPDGAYSRATRNGVISLTLLLNALATMSFTIVSVSTPYIGRALSLTDDEELWLTDAYLISLLCIALYTGWLMSRLGYRRLLLMSSIGVAAGTLGCTLVGGLAPLALLCFALGLFSGSISPTTQALIVRTFPGEARGRAMAIWGAGSTLGILLGALASGYLVEHLSWRAPFYICIPLALAAIPLILRFVVDERRAAVRLDPVEAAMLTAAVVALSALLNLGDNYGWFSSPAMIALLGIFLGSGAIYLRHLRRSSGSMLDIGLLGNRGLALASLVTLGVGFFSTGQFQTDMLGGVLSDSPELISLRSALGAVALTGGIMLGGRLTGKVRPAPLAALAIAIALVGKLGFTAYGPDITPYQAIWPQIVSGFGLGLMSTPVAVAAFATIAREKTDQATGIFVLASRLGGALGVAILGVVLDRLQAGAAGGTRLTVESTAPFLAIFWIELVGTAAFLPPAMMLGRAPALDTTAEPQRIDVDG